MKDIKGLGVWLLLPLLTVAILTSSCQSEQNRKKERAKKRVTGILEGILDRINHTTFDEERSCCLWWRNKTTFEEIDQPKLAKDSFKKWRENANILPLIREFSIIDAQLINKAVLVTGTINKLEFVMRVPDDKTEISWIQIPRDK